MNPKKIITTLLLLFVVAAIGTMVVREYRTDSAEESALANSQSSQEQSQSEKQDEATQTILSNEFVQSDANIDVVYYFMTTQRCPSCMKIESYTKQAVDQNFSKELQDKELVWRMINVDDPSNRHFIQDYELFTKSVVLVKFRDGKQVEWKNLDRVWNLLNDEAAFRHYITDELKAFLQEV